MTTGRTIRQRTTGNPLNPNDSTATMVKPAELIDCIAVTPLSLTDRRTYNLLIAHAWDRISENVEHKIPKSVLRGAHKGNERLADTIRNLRAIQVELRYKRDDSPIPYVRNISLLSRMDRPVEESNASEADPYIYYKFDENVRDIIQTSNIFARLQTEVMFCFSSHYALALYEMIQKRGNMQKTTEEFEIEDFRKLLGVMPGKLEAFQHFRARAIEPAVEEVNAFSDYFVQVDVKRQGRKVTHVVLMWARKDEAALEVTYDELQRHRAGRKARVTGLAEMIAGPPQAAGLLDENAD